MNKNDLLRLARLAHPGRGWTPQSDCWATARVERDMSGDVWIGFNADSLDDLAKVEAVVLRFQGCEQALSDAIEEIQGHDGRLPAFANPDARRRALIAVLDAHPEIEER